MSGHFGTFRGTGDTGPSYRLRGWKQIATYFGTNERTVKRWEVKRGLPVHRAGGGSGVSVYADARELESWLSDRAPVAAAAAPRPARRRIALAVAVLTGAAATAAVLLGPAPSGHRPSQAVAELQLNGLYYLERRTPESLRQAQALFSSAIRRDPLYAPAHAGLANSWLLLREYAPVPEAAAYSHARAAAQRAIDLDPRLADGHLALAFVHFFGDRRFRTGLAGFERAIALDPRSARARHWYATALSHAGDEPRALEHIDAAQQLDPQSRSIRADKGWILYLAGRRAESLAWLRQLETSDPDFYSPHYYLANLALVEGDDAGFVREARTAARLRKDRDQLALADAAEAGLRRGGHEAMLRAMLAAPGPAGSGLGPYRAATILALLGDRPQALRRLAYASASGDPGFVALRADPSLASLRTAPEFRRLSASFDG